MKRFVCPACGKPLMASSARLGQAIPCPTCKNQLVWAASGLAVAVEPSRSPHSPAPRPKRSLVAVTPPERKPLRSSQDKEPPPPPAFAASVALMTLRPSATEHAAESPSPVIVSLGSRVGRQPGGWRRNPSFPTQSGFDRRQPRSENRALPPPGTRSSADARSPVGTKPVETKVSTPHHTDDPIQPLLGSVAVVAVPGEGHGSGFVAAPGMLVTNHHVIEDAVIRDLRITFPDNAALAGRPLRAKLIHLSMPDDLAFLAIDADVPPLVVQPDYRHANGRRVVAIGSPGSGVDGPTLENLTTDGRLGPEVKVDSGEKRWSLSMTVNGGNSGGPLVDAKTGEVAGVIAAKFTQTEAQSLAVPHAALARELTAAKQTSADSRAAVLSLHRQRFCLRGMARILGITSFAFDRSIAAALANSDEGAPGMDAAFNECKSMAADLFAEKFADFSGTIGGEVDDLQNDPHCDPRIRRGLHKLFCDIEEQAEEIRLGHFRGSVEGSRELVESLADRLQIKVSEEE